VYASFLANSVPYVINNIIIGHLAMI